MIATVATAVAERTHGPKADDVVTAAGAVFGGVLVLGAGIIALGVRNRRRVVAIVLGCAAGAGLYTFPLGIPGFAALATAGAVLVGGAFVAFTSVFSVRLLNADTRSTRPGRPAPGWRSPRSGCGSGGTCTTCWGATSR